MAHVLSKHAERVFRNAIAKIPADKGHVIIGEQGGAYMPLHVECVGSIKHGTPGNEIAYKLYSMAHYYEQNGDLMSDPEMVFEDIGEHGMIPVSYKQDALGIYNEVYAFDANTGCVSGVRLKLRQDLVRFANAWAKNLHGKICEVSSGLLPSHCDMVCREQQDNEKGAKS